jgi:hypothetical protein
MCLLVPPSCPPFFYGSCGALQQCQCHIWHALLLQHKQSHNKQHTHLVQYFWPSESAALNNLVHFPVVLFDFNSWL